VTVYGDATLRGIHTYFPTRSGSFEVGKALFYSREGRLRMNHRFRSLIVFELTNSVIDIFKEESLARCTFNSITSSNRSQEEKIIIIRTKHTNKKKMATPDVPD